MNLRKDYSKYELISFDIFDTLLLRAVAKPIDIFEILWEKSEILHLIDISPKEFVKVRVEMERNARNKKKSREVNLREIYAEMPDYIVEDKIKLLQMEIEIEKQYCYRNDSIYDLAIQLKNDGKILVLLSDMYLSACELNTILEYNDIDTTIFSNIIVSNEKDCTKQTGMLYEELFKLYPTIPKENIHHIGDNKNGDYNQAINRGICAVHYDAIPDKLRSIYDYEKIRHNIPQKEILSLRKVTVYDHMDEMVSNEEKLAYEIGASIVGPFLTMYVDHICERLQKLKINAIYPLMREGYILGKLIENEVNYRNIHILVKPIYVSRKVTYIPSIEVLDREEIENMIGARNLTIKESIELMGLSVNNFIDLKEYENLKWKETHKVKVENKILKEILINKFLEPENKSKMESYIKEQRSLLIDYLKQEMNSFCNVATVDVGFFGRIQLWLEKALDLSKIEHSMKHFLAVGVTGDKIFNNMNIEGYYGTITENGDLIATIHRTTDIIEKFISVTEGSTIGYQRNDNKIQPIKSEPVANDAITQASFRGILDFQKAFHSFKDKKPLLASRVEKNRRETLMIMHRLIDMPRLIEAELVADLEADTNFGTSYRRSIITEENKMLLKEKGTDFIDKCNISYTYEDNSIVWPKGLITLEDSYYYVRRALKNSAGNEIAKSMQSVVEKVQNDGVKEIALYGAGENGRQFYFMCNLYNIKVNCFVDRKESLWGTEKEGIKVVGLTQAIEKGNNKFIITSLFSISEIEDYIRETFALKGKSVMIYSV